MKRDKKSSETETKMIYEMQRGVLKRERFAGIISAASALILAVLSFSTSEWEECTTVLKIVTIGATLLGVCGIVLYIKNHRKYAKYEESYQYYVEAKRITNALLTATKRTDFAKTCSILQTSYGHVHEWRPFNYSENILVYDIHQHLRDLCIRLKELIVNLMPQEFNDDMVTVDLAFTYPSDELFQKNGLEEIDCAVNRSADKAATQKAAADNKKWKIITSGDHTSFGVNLHEYLSKDHSFYKHLGEQGYVFANDKSVLESENHYIWSSKDDEHHRSGSIVGSVIELKNDTPETVFVRAYLTITTYGRKFVEATDSLKETDFERLLKETVINSYKTRIEAELSQMFIRHGIREKYISRQTGEIAIDTKKIKKAAANDDCEGKDRANGEKN